MIVQTNKKMFFKVNFDLAWKIIMQKGMHYFLVV